MKKSKYIRKVITISFLALSLLTSVAASNFDNPVIIETFKKAVILNEKFKESVTSDRETYNVLRKEVEEYTEAKLNPALQEAVSILSTKDDLPLMISLLDVVVSYRNSADETLAYSLGEIFRNNRQLFEMAMSHFQGEKRQIIAKSLKGVGLNVEKKDQL